MNHQVSVDEIVIGQPLRWNVMDSSGHLLLRQGYVIESMAQAEALVERGMYIKQGLAEGNRQAQEQHPIVESPAALRTINLVVNRLGMVSRDIQQFPDARAKILELGKALLSAIRLNEDLALASIQLNQSSGPYAVRHCVDTAILAVLVAQSMNKTEQEIQDITAAALTMNIAMLGMQERLQGKKDALHADERAHICQHPIASVKMLHDAGIKDPDWLNYVLLHHEHEDGSGYPIGVLKSEIPQNVKILSLADVYCARVSSRGYRKSMLPKIALRDIFIENGAHVDATLAAYFMRVLGLYPPGTFVRLKNQEIAVVSERTDDPTASLAHALVKPNGELLAVPAKRDTRVVTFSIADAISAIEASVHVNMQSIWGSLAII